MNAAQMRDMIRDGRIFPTPINNELNSVLAVAIDAVPNPEDVDADDTERVAALLKSVTAANGTV